MKSSPLACSVCGQKEATLILRQKCHPLGGLEAEYHPKLHSFTLKCAVCQALVTTLKLADLEVKTDER